MRKSLCFMLALVVLACGLFTIPVAASSTALTPNGFALKIDDNNQVSNGVGSNVYLLSEKNGVPTVGTDAESGNKYLKITKTENKALTYSMYSAGAGNQAGLFWKYFWNFQNSANNDTSFTWEFLVRMPAMNSTPNDFANVFGYRAGEGGFGFRIGNTQGQLVFGSGKTGNAFIGSQLIALSFPMEANEWYHCVLTYDYTNKIMNAYVNGEALKDGNNATDIAVDWFVAAPYNWSSAEMGIGIAPEHSAVVFDSDIGMYNFSEYSVDANEAAQLWAKADNQWKLTPAQPTPSATPSATPSTTPSATPSATQTPVVPQPPTGDAGIVIAGLVLLVGVGVVMFVRKRKITE
ncbi:MAG: hypothetical protein J6L76_07940 [Clostridia bacterium]|nr:hypothetical protein [Clostridia bacterium]